jgi:hypothetical protein
MVPPRGEAVDIPRGCLRAQFVDDRVVPGGEPFIEHAAHEVNGGLRDVHVDAPDSAG